jgi:hypothetical protein
MNPNPVLNPNAYLNNDENTLARRVSNFWAGLTNMFSHNTPNTSGGGKKQKKRKVGKSKGRTLRKGKSSGRKGKSSGRKGKSRGRKSHSRKH